MSIFTKSAVAALCLSGTAAMAGSNPYLGEIMPMANGYCPENWTETNGQLLSIADNQALFAQIGITFGGDGRTTFALPNLQARIPIHTGAAQGFQYLVGMSGGAGATTFTQLNLPPHTHSAITNAESTLTAQDIPVDTNSPVGAYMGVLDAGGADEYTTDLNANQAMMTGNVATQVSTALQATGGQQSVSTVSPYLVVRFCIALDGTWPPRS